MEVIADLFVHTLFPVRLVIVKFCNEPFGNITRAITVAHEFALSTQVMFISRVLEIFCGSGVSIN